MMSWEEAGPDQKEAGPDEKGGANFSVDSVAAQVSKGVKSVEGPSGGHASNTSFQTVAEPKRTRV